MDVIADEPGKRHVIVMPQWRGKLEQTLNTFAFSSFLFLADFFFFLLRYEYGDENNIPVLLSRH